MVLSSEFFGTASWPPPLVWPKAMKNLTNLKKRSEPKSFVLVFGFCKLCLEHLSILSSSPKGGRRPPRHSAIHPITHTPTQPACQPASPPPSHPSTYLAHPTTHITHPSTRPPHLPTHSNHFDSKPHFCVFSPIFRARKCPTLCCFIFVPAHRWNHIWWGISPGMFFKILSKAIRLPCG